MNSGESRQDCRYTVLFKKNGRKDVCFPPVFLSVFTYRFGSPAENPRDSRRLPVNYFVPKIRSPASPRPGQM